MGEDQRLCAVVGPGGQPVDTAEHWLPFARPLMPDEVGARVASLERLLRREEAGLGAGNLEETCPVLNGGSAFGGSQESIVSGRYYRFASGTSSDSDNYRCHLFSAGWR